MNNSNDPRQPDLDLTQDHTDPSPSPAHRRSPSHDSALHSDLSSHRDGFVAGSMVGERYRIVAPIGKGGMGEVWRADDLELGHPIALKFLSVHLSQSPQYLAQLKSEVRIARRIAHQNVCRVYDIANDGRDYFLTMEFVDGEDLSSMLRRLGRPSTEKALELARQICAGLHAAHELGVLHRDLKPGNILLDERGRARITDFGLAAMADELVAKRQRAGTPAYMAPEQYEQGIATVKSDLYALGLVLYELFTGKSAFEGKTLDQLVDAKRTHNITSMSSWVDTIDPAIESCIQRCLNADPKERPASAMAVAKSLPGGDPLAAALAAGETPSPELVAASDAGQLFKPWISSILVAIVFVALFLSYATASRTELINRTPLPKSLAVLGDRATELAKQLGYNDILDRESGIYADERYLDYLDRQQQPSSAAKDSGETSPSNDTSLSADALKELRRNRFEPIHKSMPASIRFWFRHASRVMIPAYSGVANASDFVTTDNPPVIQPGMTLIEFSPEGHLLTFYGVPAKNVMETNADGETADPPKTADWDALIKMAGLDPSQLQPGKATRALPIASDERVAFVGTLGGTNIPVRVEGTSFRGRVTSFEVLGPWQTTNPARRSVSPFAYVTLLVGCLIVLGASMLVRSQIKQRKGDKIRAFRVALLIVALNAITWLLGLSHGMASGELAVQTVGIMLIFAVARAAFAWALYFSLEPYIRRKSPSKLISSTRLLDGKFFDPIVGRDILLGVAIAAFANVLNLSVDWMVESTSRMRPDIGFLATVGSARITIAFFVDMIIGALVGAMVMLILPLLLQIVLRSWVVVTAAMIVLVGLRISTADNSGNLLVFTIHAMTWGLTLFAVYRFGLLTGLVSIMTVNILSAIPMANDLTAWYAQGTLVEIAFIASLALFSFWTSTLSRIHWDELFAKA